MAALEFMLFGVSLALLNLVHKQAARVFVFIALSTAALIALECALSVDLGVDQLLGSDYVRVGSAPSARMSPVTAFGFLAIGLALVGLSRGKTARYAPAVAGILGSVVISLGVIGVLQYAVGSYEGYGWGYFTGIAIHTAAGLALIGIGTVAWAWQESSVNQTARGWLPLSIGLGLGAGSIGLWQALVVHQESQLPVLSYIVLAAGLLAASLIAISLAVAQKARLRSRQLQENKEAFEGLFEGSPDALIVTNSTGRIVGANQRAEDIFGYARGELLGQSVECLVPEELRNPHLAHRQRYWSHPGLRPMGQGLDLKARRKDGTKFPVDVSLSPLRPRGELQVLAAVRDITERRYAEEALRESEERFRRVFEVSPLGMALIQPDYRLAKVNASLCRMSGYSEAELIGRNPFDLTTPEDLQKSMTLAQRLFNGEIPFYQIEKRYLKKSGEIVWATMTATLLRDRQGRPLLGLGMMEDITERKRVQEALRQSEERFRSLIEQGPIGIILLDRDYRLLQVNAAFCHMLGYSEAELMRMDVLDVTHPHDRQSTIHLTERLFTAAIPLRKQEERYVKKNGEVIWGSVTASLIHDQEGKPLYAMAMIEDITERRRTEAALRQSTERIRNLIEQAPIGITLVNRDYRLLKVNAAFCRMLGYSEAELMRMSALDVTHADDRQPTMDLTEHLFTAEIPLRKQEKRYVKKTGEVIWVSVTASLIHDQEGKPLYAMTMIEDITERKRTEAELRALTQRLSLAARGASLGVWDWNLSTDLGVWDDRMLQIFGIPQRAYVTREDWVPLLHPDDQAKTEAFLASILRGKTQDTVEFRVLRPDGSVRYVSAAGGPVLDKNGSLTGIVGIAMDVTERRQLEQKLEDARQQAIISARLAAVGTMAGGVAHEINNPLAIIHAMASDLAEMVAGQGSAPPEVVARTSQVIRDTAERIAKIVKSLRHISREGAGEPFRPTPLADIVARTLDICRAKFRDNGVDLLLPRAIPELDVFGREVQIAQALLNLLQNALDAVVGQKDQRWVRLEIQPARDSVVISVIDGGPGIPPEIRSRVMEPFFTTKPVGKALGLGLSLSKAMAEDHGGRLEYSEENGHTRFSLVLPLSTKAEAA